MLRVDIKLNPCLYVYQPGALGTCASLTSLPRYANPPSIREKMVFISTVIIYDMDKGFQEGKRQVFANFIMW